MKVGLHYLFRSPQIKRDLRHAKNAAGRGLRTLSPSRLPIMSYIATHPERQVCCDRDFSVLAEFWMPCSMMSPSRPPLRSNGAAQPSAPRWTRAAEARGPPACVLLQDPGRLQPHLSRLPRRKPRPRALSVPRPATMPRGSRSRPTGSGIAATIVMPITTPTHQGRCSALLGGGTVVLHGDAFDEADAHARVLEQEQGLSPSCIPTSRWRRQIASQEHHRRRDPASAIPIRSRRSSSPIGGEGLAAGVLLPTSNSSGPRSQVIGVEPVDAASMKAAIAAGERVVLDRVGLFADGVAVRQAGEETFPPLRVNCSTTC